MRLEYIFAIFALVGVLDRITGNHFKLGDEFEKGIMTTGPLIVSMAGMLVLAPLLSEALSFVFKPVLSLINVDLSFLGAFFPVDAGGALMAYEISSDTLIRGYNGIVVASMFGATICPVIPMALNMVEKEYHSEVLVGLLCGIATIPTGCIIAGILIGCSFTKLLLNTLPIIILSAVISIGLIKKPDLVKKIFAGVGNLLFLLVITGLGIGIFHKLTGTEIIKNTESIDEAFLIIGNIAIILSGVFVLLAVISKLFNKVFMKLGNLLKINNTAVLGLITSLANSIPVFSMIKDMDKKGRIMNMAFGVSGAYAFGDHLAFVLSFDRNFAVPMVIGKLISGVASLILAQFIYKKMRNTEEV